MMDMKEPPLGLVPRFIRNLQRIYEICAAIDRYAEANMFIKTEWLEELNECVLEELRSRKSKREE